MLKQTAFLMTTLLITTLLEIASATIKLSVVQPALLKNHFKSGLEFKEIINGHRLQSFDDRVDIHMLQDKNATGCHRYNTEDVPPL